MEDSKIRIHYGEKVMEFKLPEGWSLLGNFRTWISNTQRV